MRGIAVGLKLVVEVSQLAREFLQIHVGIDIDG